MKDSFYFYNLPQKFKNITDLCSKNVAIRSDINNVSYSQLNTLADNYANTLIIRNLKKGDVVAIFNTKEIESYALMLACLKIGAPYVNIDVNNPLSRTLNIFETCKPKCVFTDSVKQNDITDYCALKNVLYFDKSEFENIKLSNQISDSLIDSIDGDTIAYIMFTSGSTGSPKGVAITHQALLHFIAWGETRFGITSDDNFANLSPMYFDNSVFDFYSALFTGASLTPIKKEQFEKPLELVKYITDKKCTIWFSVPSLMIYLMNMKVVKSDFLSSIRFFSFGGEGYPKKELNKLYNIYNKHADIYIVYGPSECTCICSSYLISESDFNDLSVLPSLGKINPNFSYIIINEHFEESIEGELCLLGPNVGLGYYNDEERSSKHFSIYKEKIHYGKRMYRTGDLVKEENGLLYFKGRKDFQIKHMGYRIEIEEIELAISTIEAVKECAVLYHRVNDSYGKIVAFIATSANTLDDKYVQSQLFKKLPPYMIPSTYRFLSHLPKNANGKIDKKELEILINNKTD